jgi:hypothetical protein
MRRHCRWSRAVFSPSTRHHNPEDINRHIHVSETTAPKSYTLTQNLVGRMKTTKYLSEYPVCAKIWTRGFSKTKTAMLFTWIFRVHLLGIFLSKFTFWSDVFKTYYVLGNCLWYEETAMCSEISLLHCVQSLGTVDILKSFDDHRNVYFETTVLW